MIRKILPRVTARTFRTAHAAGVLLVALLPMAIAAGGCRRPAIVLRADAFDVTAAVASDGTATIAEQITIVAPASEPFVSFTRTVDAHRSDGITLQSAELDGATVAPGPALDVETTAARLRVRWIFGDPAVRRHTLALRYVIQHPLEIRDGHGLLAWSAIPAGHPFAITASRLTASAPDTAEVFPLAGVAEAGWTVARTPHGITATARDLAPGTPATLLLEMSVPATMLEPVWQRRDARNADLAPAFWSAGLITLLVGVGILWIVRFQYPKRRRPAGAEPDPERTLVAAGLRMGGRVTMASAVVCAIAVRLLIPDFGIAAQALPAAILIVGLMLEIAGQFFK
jgi:hypothetical protein